MKRIIIFFLLALAFSPVAVLADDNTASLIQRAQKGDVPAQAHLGWAYHQGLGVPADDAEALRWLHKAARKNDAEAEYHLGLLYEWGQGAALNFPEAFKWFRKAAEQGELPAQMALGNLYLQGWGTRADRTEACFWYLVAARSGAPVAVSQRDALQSRLDPARLPALQKRAAAWRPGVVSTDASVASRRHFVSGRRHPGALATSGESHTISQ